MAIVIEEEKPKISVTQALMWLVVLVIVGAAVYYIFFAKPQIIDVATPPHFQNIDPLSEISLIPEEVTASEAFNALQVHVTPPAAGNAGRANPFVKP